GEYLALGASLEHLARQFDNPRAQVLADALDAATGRFLEANKGPSRKVGERDNRGAHFYVAMYWARALADQDTDSELKAIFGTLADTLEAGEEAIVADLNNVQGNSVDIGGYYRPDRPRHRCHATQRRLQCRAGSVASDGVTANKIN